MTQNQARDILDRVISLSKADEMEATITAGDAATLRFAQSEPTSSTNSRSVRLTLSAAFGKRVGHAGTTQTSESDLVRAVRRCEDSARLGPESPEYMPRLPQQHYGPPAAEWDDATAAQTANDRAAMARSIISAADSAGLSAAGIVEQGASLHAVANSAGLFASHPGTIGALTISMRQPDGAASGWQGDQSFAAGNLAVDAMAAQTATIAASSREPVELPAGDYRAVLSRSAVADMVGYLYWNMGRREADEQKGYFTPPGGGRSIGDRVFSECVTVRSDPNAPDIPSCSFDREGQPIRPTLWIENGVVRNLRTSRYWAEQVGAQPVPDSRTVLMDGADIDDDALIAETEYGLYINSFWYIRTVDPRTMVLTGVTRDGLFLIENGRIAKPVVNFRWNESPAALMQRIEGMSRAKRALGRETGWVARVPSLRVSSFHFASVSPAV